MSDGTEARIVLRSLLLEDYQDTKKAMLEAYAGTDTEPWGIEDIQRLIDVFPDGQLCIEVDGKVAALALAIIVDYSKYGDKHTFKQITGNYSFSTHNPDGDVLYGIEVFVHPKYRGMRLGRRLYDARKELCENLNLRSIIAGGRIPNYEKFAFQYTPRQYIDKVRQREIYDPALTFQLSNDFHARKILKNYAPEDTQSHSFATLLEWKNIYFEPEEKLVGAIKENVRIGVVQWQMRSHNSFDSLVEQMEYFIDAVSDYGSDFCVFPEYFCAPLMAEFNHLNELEAIRGLAKYSDALHQRFLEFSVSYNVNIIGGSMPVIGEDDRLRNMSCLYRRDGTHEKVEKLHPTPDEVSRFGMVGGNKIPVFETDAGKVGILICYDVEFPEIPRLMADQGMQILFVPFMTDTQNGYNRVRYCARARAIENECYVAIAGCVGNLPRVHNMDIQYAQSAIFTPSDFAFPVNTIKAQATANTEMTLIADVHLPALKELHNYGSVQNLRNRRKDLYSIVRTSSE